jgi:hypothetical protein
MWSVGIELQSFEEGKEAVVRSALDSVVGSQEGQGQLELQPSRARGRNCGRVWYSFRRPVRLQLTRGVAVVPCSDSIASRSRSADARFKILPDAGS